MVQLTIDDHCTLRRFRVTDKSRLVELANNPRVSSNLRDAFPYPYTQDDADQWFKTALNQQQQHIFAIAQSDQLIGGIGFHPLDDVYRHTAELGYWLGEPYWGKGIMSRAVAVIVQLVFTTTDLTKLFAGVFSNNPASAAVLEKNSFYFEGRLRNAVVKRGKVLDELRYGLLREEWEKK